MRETDWVSAHVFCHADHDRLLVELVVPLLAELATDGLCQQYFFLRYWEGGPHVRVRMLAAPADHGELRERVVERCERFFDDQPATRTVAATDYVQSAARLAHREGRHHYVRQLYPNNSVVFLPYRREHDRYGYGASMEAVEQHFVESSRIALGLVAAGITSRQRDTAALSMLLLTWLGLLESEGSVDHSLARTTSHAVTEPDPLQRQTARRLAERMRGIAAQGSAAVGDGAFAAWTRSTARLQTALSNPPAWQVLDTCGHLVCNRLGVLPDSEAYLRYLAAESLTEMGIQPRAQSPPARA